MPTRDRGFVWGCNGHPFSQEAYIGNIDLQLALLKETGMSYYRVDIGLNEQGIMDTATQRRFNELIRKAFNSHITIVPIIFPPGRDVLYALPGPETAYEKGLVLGHGFAASYGRDIIFYELGNENDADLLNDPPGDGSDSSQYSFTKLRLLAGYFKGMSDGIKQVIPGAKIIISNGGWKHYAYYDLLEKEGVNFDIIGYHWYDDIPNLKAVLNKLTGDYSDKVIWFTEINRRTGSSIRNQRAMVKAFIRAIRHAGKNVTGFFIYELFDQPRMSYDVEKHYGIFKWRRYHDQVARKPVGTAVRKMIEKNDHCLTIRKEPGSR